MSASDYLQIRLRHCLQTILELEPDMERLALYEAFKEDMRSLKNFLNDIDQMDLSEKEVERLENVTARFLREIWTPLYRSDTETNNIRVLQ